MKSPDDKHAVVEALRTLGLRAMANQVGGGWRSPSHGLAHIAWEMVSESRTSGWNEQACDELDKFGWVVERRDDPRREAA